MIYGFLLILTVFAANWAVHEYGVVPVGFGLIAPAGVFFAGLAFTFRDLSHEVKGRGFVIGAILIGAALSSALSKELALASGVAFLASEIGDFAVYELLRRRGWIPAVVFSNIVGLTLDSAIFLLLAFGSLEFLGGQLLAKLYMTAAAIAILWLARHHVFQDRLPVRGASHPVLCGDSKAVRRP